MKCAHSISGASRNRGHAVVTDTNLADPDNRPKVILTVLTRLSQRAGVSRQAPPGGRRSDKIFKTPESMGNDSGRMSTMIAPRLVVPDPDAAIAFYRAALEAGLVARFELDDGTVTHAELDVDGASFSVTAEVAAWGLLSPESVGGSPTLVTLTVPDAPSSVSRWWSTARS